MNEYIYQVLANAVYVMIDKQSKEVLYCYESLEDAQQYCITRTNAGYPCYIKQLGVEPTSTAIKIRQLVTQSEEQQDLILSAARVTAIDEPLRFQTPSLINIEGMDEATNK